MGYSDTDTSYLDTDTIHCFNLIKGRPFLAVRYQHVGADHQIWLISLEMRRKAQGESRQDRPAAGCIDSTTDSFGEGEEMKGSGQR